MSEEQYAKLLRRVACNERQVAKRGFFVEEALDTNFATNPVYPLKESPRGASMHRRHEFYHQAVTKVFDDIYEEREFPDDIIHVSCTGYVSPSAAQMVAVRSPKPVTVTHSYHMGCYGAFPALRMATGFLANDSILGQKKTVDLVHTELCSLHLAPDNPTLEQMVIQSLFADGCIAYSLTTVEPIQGFRMLSLYEEIIPNTSGAMEWVVSDWGMKMTLSRDVPKVVGNKIRDLTMRWLERIGIDFEMIRSHAVFAVHPGGPKIIDQVVESLQLKDSQVAGSRSILRDRGNMSSATLPHLWERLLKDPNLPSRTPVISYAFGPGLTVCMSLMEKL